MKKILCIHQGWELYGSDRSFLINLEILKENFKNIELDVIIPKEGPIIPELKKITSSVRIGKMGKVERKEISSRPFKSIFKILFESKIAYAEMRKSDMVYINTVAPYSYLLASFFFRKKVIVHVREIPPKKIALLFSWWFKMCGVSLIFNSKATQIAFNFENNSKGRVILNAVEGIQKTESKINPSAKINILLIGRINSWKGHFFTLEVLKNFDKELHEKFQFIFLGSTPEGQEFYEKDLRDKISEYSLGDLVSIVPFNSNPEFYYNWSDYVLVPSINPEPFGRVAAEAFSTGKPVIGSNHGGIAEIVIHENNGYLFTPSSVSELLTVFKGLEKESEVYKILCKNAYISYLKKYTIDVYKMNFLDFITRK